MPLAGYTQIPVLESSMGKVISVQGHERRMVIFDILEHTTQKN